MIALEDQIPWWYGYGLVRFQEAGAFNNGFATLLEKRQRDSCDECLSTETNDGLSKHHIRTVRAFPIRTASHNLQGEQVGNLTV